MKPDWDVLQPMSKSSTAPLTPQALNVYPPLSDYKLLQWMICFSTRSVPALQIQCLWNEDVMWKNIVKKRMQNLPGSPNSLESISSFCCSSFSLSFFCFFSISLFLSSSCSPSSITLNALSSASYSSVRVLSNVLRLSTWFSNASSAEGGGQTPEQKEKRF